MRKMMNLILSGLMALSLFDGSVIPLAAEEEAPEDVVLEGTEEGENEESIIEELPADEEITAEEEEVPAEEELQPETSEAADETEEVPAEEITEETEEPVSEEVTEEVTEEEPEEVTEETKETEEEVVEEEEDEDFKTFAVGSDGVAYDGVSYLSVGAVKRMPEDAQQFYYETCDEIAQSFNSGADLENVVFSVDAYGKLSFLYEIPLVTLYEDESDPVIYDPSLDVFEEEDDSDETGFEPVLVEEEEEEPSEFFADIVEENNELFAEKDTVAEEWIDEDEEFIPSETLMKNENYFYNQLSSVEMEIYDAAYKTMVKKNKNSATLTGYGYSNGSTRVNSYYWVNAVSALINTYPSRFDWMNIGTGRLSVSGKYYYGSGKYVIKGKATKSKYYSKSLENKAKAKVKELVKEANDYAVRSYPSNPTYGIVKFLDNWLANKYYNWTGTNEDKKTRGSKVYYYCHSSYGLLLKGYGVCESFAKAMSRLLDYAGIRNMYVCGNGHAWNYVQMPNGQWYMQDSTWNCNNEEPWHNYTPGTTYLLSAKDSKHYAEGRGYTSGKTFTFPTLATSRYSASSEKSYMPSIPTLPSAKALKAKKKVTLTFNHANGSDAYYEKFPVIWASSNPKVAKVSSKGVVTAVKPGLAQITATFAGTKRTCNVYVYQFTSLKFDTNKKTALKDTFAVNSFNTTKTYVINVAQKNKATTAANIRSYAGLSQPTVKSSKPSVATATATVSGDTIRLNVTALKLGTSVITVKFGGKSAKLTVTVKQNIQTSWFDRSALRTVIYTGKAYKPKITKSVNAPAGLTYKTVYQNNVNAGTATVTVKGTGKYGGSITYSFNINAENLNNLNTVFKSCTAYKYYNGSQFTPKTVVTIGKKTLKAEKDYRVYYGKNGRNFTTTAPSAVGSYTVQIRGIGNYTGTLSQTKTFEIR